MKIICIGRNYAKHISELNNETPDNPVIFLKPETALLKDNKPFYYPDFSKDVHYECELVIKISKNGKYIEEKFASTYYDQVTLGIDFTARDLQSVLKSKGLPWEISKGFDSSAVVGNFVNKSNFTDLQSVNFSFYQNDQVKQHANTSLMLYKIDFIISYVSRFFSLKQGDLIFTGTPEGVGPVAIGDKLSGQLEGEALFNIQVK